MLQSFRAKTNRRLRRGPIWLVAILAALITAGCGGAAPTPTSSPTEATPTAASAAAVEPCSSVSEISMLQTPAPTTPAPSATAPSASPTPPPPTATPRPAPEEDRIGFPEGYQDNFSLLFVYDRLDNRQVRIVCGNEMAASIKPGEPFPHGSILVMETWRTRQDASGSVMKDDNGRFIREALLGIFVMRKEPGFGAEYQELRTGEWEYVAYRPDGTYLAAPEQTANCAACHIGATEDKDWIFRANELFFEEGRYAQAPAVGPNEISLNSMGFFPRMLSAKVGTSLTWTNNDVVAHTITADDGSVDSGILNIGNRFTFTFDQAGEFEYHCSIHPEQMKATVEVTN